jgi:hypothetical protein
VKDEWIVSPPPIISTEGEGADRAIKQYRYAITGELLSHSEIHLPLVRTVLSVANLADNPTALLARREMQSWSLVLLEPSSLRQPDEFTAPTKLGKIQRASSHNLLSQIGKAIALHSISPQRNSAQQTRYIGHSFDMGG